MIFLTSAILISLSLFFFSKIIVNQEIWIFSEMIRENNRFFHEEIIKSYINMIIERLVNAFDEFVKRIKRVDMMILDINVYWNVMSNISVASSNIFKLFMLILDFATFRLFEKFDVDIHMQLQNAEWFKRITQQTLEKLNFEKSWIDSLSNQFMRNWRRKQWFWWFRKHNCLFEMIVRADCLISWRLFIMIKRRSSTEERTCVTRWILLSLCYFCCSYTELMFHSEVSYIFSFHSL